jgi:hypothetical protein
MVGENVRGTIMAALVALMAITVGFGTAPATADDPYDCGEDEYVGAPTGDNVGDYDDPCEEGTDTSEACSPSPVYVAGGVIWKATCEIGQVLAETTGAR